MPGQIARFTTFVAASLVLVVIGIAGLGKLVSLDEFWWTLVRDHGLATIPAAALGASVAGAELLLAGLWFANWRRRAVGSAAIALLTAFTVYLLYERMTREAPTCSCFGILAQYASWLDDTRTALVRNVVMIAALGCYLFCECRRAARTIRSEGAP